MSDRELVADLLTKLPEDASLDVIKDQIELLAGIRRAREQARRGEGRPIEEVRKFIGTWAGQ
jgi:hypothetical protein